MDFGGLSVPLSIPTVLSALCFLIFLNFKQAPSGNMQPFGRMKESVCGSREAYRGSWPAQ